MYDGEVIVLQNGDQTNLIPMPSLTLSVTALARAALLVASDSVNQEPPR